MRPRPKVIVLAGVDGSGKTTHARWLAEWLTASGTPATYFENGGGRPLFDAIAHRLGRADGRALFGRRGYLALEVSLRGIAITRALALATVRRRVAVMDRYAYCQLAIMGARGDGGERLVRTLYAVFPRPDVVFYLALPAEEAARRVKARGYDEEDPAYLSAADAAYRSLPEFPAFTVIDAAGSSDALKAALIPRS
jgi:dTMP kinase